MEDTNKSEEFKFTYSAKEQEELRKIRQKYVPKEVDRMEQLRKLDAGVTRKAVVISLVAGIIGALVLGFGMSLIMTDVGETLGLYGKIQVVLGVVIGMIGVVLVSTAYPIYNKIARKERERIAPEIIRLIDELMNSK